MIQIGDVYIVMQMGGLSDNIAILCKSIAVRVDVTPLNLHPHTGRAHTHTHTHTPGKDQPDKKQSTQICILSLRPGCANLGAFGAR